MDVLAAMQGKDGLGRGLTTYPDSQDEEQLEMHRDCLKLEREGKIMRHHEGARHADGALSSEGQRFVIWMPVDEVPAVLPASTTATEDAGGERP